MENTRSRPVLKPWPLDWKAKVGILMPSHDTGYSTYEYQILFPEGVVPLQTRLKGGRLTKEAMMRMRADAVYGAEILAVAEVAAISYIGTAACYVWGVEGDKALIREIEEKTGVKATTGGTAVVEAFAALGIKKMLLYSPYNEELSAMTIKFLEDQGLAVAAQTHLNLEDMTAIKRISPLEIYSSIMKLHKRCPDADGIFISGGCLRTLDIIAMLEEDTGLPLVTTTPANVWKLLQLAEVKDPVFGFGKLLELPR
jgi:maleate isomerase